MQPNTQGQGQGQGYEVIYGVGLLDDLHNYFPALLYDQGRFQTINSVFHYIRTEMAQRFNLFALGANRWRAAEAHNGPHPTPAPRATATTNPIVMEETIHVDTNLAATALLLSVLGGGTTPARTTPFTPFGLGTGFGNTFLQGLGAPQPAPPLTGGQGGGEAAATRWANFLAPVVSRPSIEDIDRNTELVTGIHDTSCAICQDMIRSDDTARRLRPCRHVYHQTCIDQWFERSVFCPTCRHDIREPPS